MNQRMTKVEEQVTRLTADMAVMKANSVTRHHVECLETEMRQLISGLRSEMRLSISDLKDQMHASTSGLRTEIRTSISGLKDEMRSSTSGLRTEMRTSISGLKDEMQTSTFTLKTGLHYLLLSQTRWFCSVLLLALFTGLWCAKLIF